MFLSWRSLMNDIKGVAPTLNKTRNVSVSKIR